MSDTSLFVHSSDEYVPDSDDLQSDTDDYRSEVIHNSGHISVPVTNDSTDIPVPVKKYKGKRKIRHPENWKRNVNKLKRAKGEEYVSTSNKNVKARVTGASCQCIHRCFDKFNEE